jgi:transcription antitermination factor NusB
MKGRRQARRAALQALYELDQSNHGIDAVLETRIVDFYRTAIVGVIPPSEWSVVEDLLASWPDAVSDDTLVAAIAARRACPAPHVRVAVDAIARWAPHARYCTDVVRGVWAHRASIDAVIARIAPEWPVEQMAPVDRNVLRIALWEIATDASPLRVAINEAVELARAFSGEGARRMVNGALGAYAAGRDRLAFDADGGAGGAGGRTDPRGAGGRSR